MFIKRPDSDPDHTQLEFRNYRWEQKKIVIKPEANEADGLALNEFARLLASDGFGKNLIKVL